MKSGAPQAILRGSFVAVAPVITDSIRVFSAGRCVCSVALPRLSSSATVLIVISNTGILVRHEVILGYSTAKFLRRSHHYAAERQVEAVAGTEPFEFPLHAWRLLPAREGMVSVVSGNPFPETGQGFRCVRCFGKPFSRNNGSPRLAVTFPRLSTSYN